MTAATIVLAAAAETHGNVQAETFIFGVIAAIAFAALALVTFSYRNVANRHQRKADAWAEEHGHETHTSGH